MTYQPLARGFGFAGFRSFSGEVQRTGALTKVNVVAGQNNSGKSNILRFAHQILPTLKQHVGDFTLPRYVDALDTPLGNAAAERRITLAIDHQALLNPEFGNLHVYAAKFAEIPDLVGADGNIWIEMRAEPGAELLRASPEMVSKVVEGWDRISHGRQWAAGDHQEVLHQVLGGGSLDPLDVMRRFLERCVFHGYRAPNSAMIEASRRVESLEDGAEESAQNLAGRGLIQRLMRLQNPDQENWAESRQRFAALNSFVQTVMDNPRVSIHIPYALDTILIDDGRVTLPLSNLGTGIHQVVILAAAATSVDDTLVCVEEPETHLHPRLQRKLAEYIAAETTNQYLIASHSAHFLDFAGSTIIHVRMASDGSRMNTVKAPFEFVDVCADLGYSPADLLQANAVIWVEGPADRIYIKRWLELLDPELEEGQHYSIMFYGGSMLNHLSVDEDALKDFIALRRLNRHSTVVIDSDRTSKGKRLNATKERIRAEFAASDAPGFAMVTAGYTIENYIPRETLANAVKHVHPTRILEWGGELFRNPLPSKPKPFDKTAIAVAATELLQIGDVNRLGLKRHIDRLSIFVRNANAMPAR